MKQATELTIRVMQNGRAGLKVGTSCCDARPESTASSNTLTTCSTRYIHIAHNVVNPRKEDHGASQALYSHYPDAIISVSPVLRPHDEGRYELSMSIVRPGLRLSPPCSQSAILRVFTFPTSIVDTNGPKEDV